MYVNLDELESRVKLLETEVHRLGGELRTNTALTQQVATSQAEMAKDTAEIVAIFSEARAAFRLFDRLMRFVRYVVTVVLPVGVLFGALYILFTGKPASWIEALRVIVR